MPGARIEQDRLWFYRGVERLKAEVAMLETGLAELERANLRSPVLVQKLGRFFGFGAAGKMDWARFKLNFKQEELAQFRDQKKPEVTANRSASPNSRPRETTRLKMERMIAENPAELEPHIRRVYQSLIDAGK